MSGDLTNIEFIYNELCFTDPKNIDPVYLQNFIDLCSNNVENKKHIGCYRFFSLCEIFIKSGRFWLFKDYIIKIVSLDPKILFCHDCSEYNLFMIALEHHFNIEDIHLIEFLKSLEKILNDFRKTRLLYHQELFIGGWDIENDISNTYDEEDCKTLFGLALETGNFKLIEFCFFMGCWKIDSYDDESRETCGLFKELLHKYLKDNDINKNDVIIIDNFGNKLKILLVLELLGKNGIYYDVMFPSDLKDFLIETELDEE